MLRKVFIITLLLITLPLFGIALGNNSDSQNQQIPISLPLPMAVGTLAKPLPLLPETPQDVVTTPTPQLDQHVYLQPILFEEISTPPGAPSITPPVPPQP